MAELSEQDESDINEFERTGEISDHLFGRSVVIGIAVGTPIIGVIAWLGLSALDMATTDRAVLGLALWSALWAGVLLGAVMGVGLRLMRLEALAHKD